MRWNTVDAFVQTSSTVQRSFLQTKASDAETTTPPEIKWGESYIGGDPCGSKYNNDPHAMEISKPGMPEDMKARIQKMAEEKLRQQQEEKEC